MYRINTKALIFGIGIAAGVASGMLFPSITKAAFNLPIDQNKPGATLGDSEWGDDENKWFPDTEFETGTGTGTGTISQVNPNSGTNTGTGTTSQPQTQTTSTQSSDPRSASNKPSCADLKYNLSKTDSWKCYDKYFTCPLDPNKIKCDRMATVGDIKYSKSATPDKGWLLCDGRYLDQIENGKYGGYTCTRGSIITGSQLAKILISAGFTDTNFVWNNILKKYVEFSCKLTSSPSASNYTYRPKLPNYIGVFLSGKGTSSTNSADSNDAFTPMQASSVGAHSHKIPTYTYETFVVNDGALGGSVSIIKLTNSDPTISSGSGETCPTRIGLYTYIYAGEPAKE